MTRSELIAALAARFPQLPAGEVDTAVRVVLAEIAAALARGGRVEVRGFGSFSLHYRPPRKGRNPKTGETVEVPAKAIPYFRAGKELRERVDAAAKGASG
ncbi:MAG: integration host factor subunit beta [Hydrogenophilus sp.]|nr:integration host factor subunit beta [Hydrogenophilus sp.]